jgi:hypothetical protein
LHGGGGECELCNVTGYSIARWISRLGFRIERGTYMLSVAWVQLKRHPYEKRARLAEARYTRASAERRLNGLLLACSYGRIY